ncbi:MAG: endonuclease III domain-containing protein [Gammaproteobacteria bacterium]
MTHPSEEAFGEVYERLDAAYGPQHWWPGESPFEIQVGAILTQNTAWPNVERAIENLKRENRMAPEAILETPHHDLAELLRPAGYFNVKARRLRNYCAWLLEQGGERALRRWPTDKLRHGLLSVKGVGPETADDILLYAFERPVFVIDAYTRRIFSRLGLIEANSGYEALRHRFETALGADVARFNQYHALIVRHAKTHCRKRPRCTACPLGDLCRKTGDLDHRKADRSDPLQSQHSAP